MIVEYNNIIHSDIPNYIKLAFNSLKMIQNDTGSQPNQTGDDRLLIRPEVQVQVQCHSFCQYKCNTKMSTVDIHFVTRRLLLRL